MTLPITDPEVDQRAQRARRWAREQTGWSGASFAPASQDASFRRYFRLECAGQTRIIMDAPPERESLNAFIDIAGRLRRVGLNVPEILADDRENGFLLLEDMGSNPWHRILNTENAASMFDQALDSLVRMQQQTDASGLPEYDAGLLFSELALFPDWFLERHWHVKPTADEMDAWDHICATLIRWALDQPTVFVHRDFMPRNLMQTEPNPGILDFQDAVVGPISYDPVCLFRDAFLSWPDDQVDKWLEDFRVRALSAGLPVPEEPELWRRTCDFMGTQRHLKVLGIFARICHRDGKPHYLEDAPRFLAYLGHAAARNPELFPLTELLEHWKKRAA